ncbi:hypothetical protein [Sphingomonas sp. LT1P40]|uniref:hypothetical protein n=1 Tax=Alteristakelama amylovorans TaxID=3096166 RepID=UPI002FC6EEFB
MRTVAQVLAQCDAYLGKPVRVAGYLVDCGGYECHLFPNATAAKAMGEAWKRRETIMRQVTRGAKLDRVELNNADERVDALWPIGIGGAPGFDLKAAPLQQSYVVISGRMDDGSCDGRGGTDRSPGIHPTDIRAWTTAEGAPANIN